MERGISRFRLPGGYFDDQGRLHDTVELTPLAGRDEELLASRAVLPTTAVTLLLARVVKRIGTIDVVDEPLAQRLLVADRQFVMLKLRELTYGPRVNGSCFCDFDDCRQRVSLSFSTTDIPVKPLADKRPVYECRLTCEASAGDATVRTLALRLPTGADQEALCQVAASGGGAAEALRLLVRRCLVPASAEAEPPAGVVARLSPSDLLGIETFLAETAPAVDLEVRVPCAECRRDFSAQLDIQDFFFGELVTSAEQLYKEVHYLAFHYHWSEEEILGLSKTKRERYISILTDQLEELNAGA
jgi:hypothetical protein